MGAAKRLSANRRLRKSQTMTFITQPSMGLGGSPLSARSIHDHWRLYLAEGLILGVLGLAAFVAPLLAGLAVTLLFGWLLMIAGLIGLSISFRSRRAPGFLWALLSAIVALFAGMALLFSPVAGLLTLTYVLTAFFVIDGLFMIVLALTHRRELSARWEWMLANGIIDLILAGVIIAGLPGALLWAFGLLLGIDLMFGGATLTAMAIAARRPAGL
jgi:uncharacterized membrane protein HdeD (DUF308 family)